MHATLTAEHLTARAAHVSTEAWDARKLGVLTATVCVEATGLCEQAVREINVYEDLDRAAELIDAAANLIR